MRQFKEGTGHMQIMTTPEEVEARVNELYVSGKVTLKEGYAPFCKHIFVPNWTPTLNQTVEITPENEALLR